MSGQDSPQTEARVNQISSQIMEVAPGERIVLRLWQWNPNRLAADARKDYIHKRDLGIPDPGYSVSVFAREHQEGEALEVTISGLIEHVRSLRNAKWAAIATESELSEAGFRIDLSEPPPEHYDLCIKDPDNEQELKALEAVFNVRERRKVDHVQPR